MKELDAMYAVQNLLDQVPAGLFVTIGGDGYPRGRWMVAARLNREHGYLYAVAAADSRKLRDMAVNDKVSWHFQLPSLRELASLYGRAIALDNPRLKAEVLEAMGPNLANFWRVNPEPGHLVVIETAIERVIFNKPMENLTLEQEAAT